MITIINDCNFMSLYAHFRRKLLHCASDCRVICKIIADCYFVKKKHAKGTYKKAFEAYNRIKSL